MRYSGRTDAMMERRRRSGSSRGRDRSRSYRDSDKSFTVKLFVTIILLLFFAVPGIIALAIFAPEARKYPNAEGAQALIWLNRIVFGLIILAGIGAVLFIVIPVLFLS